MTYQEDKIIETTQEPKDCYWVGNKLIHIDSCTCDRDYDDWREQ